MDEVIFDGSIMGSIRFWNLRKWNGLFIPGLRGQGVLVNGTKCIVIDKGAV